MEEIVTLTNMKVRHSKLKLAFTELWDLRDNMNDAGYEVMHELPFTERQDVYRAASGKVATTAEELAAQLDVLILEAGDDPVCIHADIDYHGQMMRSIRAAINGLSDPRGVNIEQFWTNYASLDGNGKKVVQDTAKTLRIQSVSGKVSVLSGRLQT
ncbi:MAG: hypothetical protein AAGB07_04885 [Pseudomonadota bacterium]